MPALQTWRALGLSVAVGYTSFGALELLWPARAGRELLDIEPGQDAGADSTVALMGRLLGARDLSIAAALFALHHGRRHREMGVVIVAGTIVCLADAVAVGVRKGWAA